MNFLEFLKNANLLAVLAWVVVWNMLCGIGIYFDGMGPIHTVPGALSMLAASIFALSSTLFGLLSERGRNGITATYGDYTKLRPTLKLLAFISGILTVVAMIFTVGMIWSQA